MISIYNVDWMYHGYYQGEKPDGYYGFIYIITNKTTGMRYIGKKFFFSMKSRPPLKGRKNKRRMLVESNWKDYWGSNKQLLADIKTHGESNFKREIIKYCKTKWDCAYDEAELQFSYGVLKSNDWYNGMINLRLGRKGDI